MKDSRFFLILCVLLAIESDVIKGFWSSLFAVTAFFVGLFGLLVLCYEHEDSRMYRSAISPSVPYSLSSSFSPSAEDKGDEKV
jgi:hypothetical protein